MKDTFKLKHVTIIIDQSSLEREKGDYYLRATDPRNPISAWGKPEKIGQLFGIWLSNTIKVMNKNKCKLIKIHLSWE